METTKYCICCLDENIPFINRVTCSHTEFLKSFLIQPKTSNQMICHQCHNILKKIHQFKLHVEDSFKFLNQFDINKDTISLSWFKPRKNKLNVQHKVVDININDLEIETKKENTNLEETMDFEANMQTRDLEVNTESNIDKFTNTELNVQNLAFNITDVEKKSDNENRTLEETLDFELDIESRDLEVNTGSNIDTNTETYVENIVLAIEGNCEPCVVDVNNLKEQIENKDKTDSINSNTNSRKQETVIFEEVAKRNKMAAKTNLILSNNEKSVKNNNLREVNHNENQKLVDKSKMSERLSLINEKSVKNIEEALRIINNTANNNCVNILASSIKSIASNNYSFIGNGILNKNNERNVEKSVLKSFLGKSQVVTALRSTEMTATSLSKVKEIKCPRLASGIRGKIKKLKITEQQLLQEREELLKSAPFLKHPYRCDLCLIGFNYEVNLEDHKKRKHTQKEGGRTCRVCQQVMSDDDNFMAHHKRHYTRYQCSLCSKRFDIVDEAVRHYKMAHSLKCKRNIKIKKKCHEK